MAALAVGCGDKRLRVVEHTAYRLAELLKEGRFTGADIKDGLAAKTQHGVVVLGTGMLDEEQRRGYRQGRMTAGHDDGVEHGLQVVVGMLFQEFGTENGIDIRQRFHAVGTGLVVNDTDKVVAASISHHVQSVYTAANVNAVS